MNSSRIDRLRAMLLIRAFERRLMARPDHGFQLFSSGEEAVAVGVAAALKPDDQLLCSGRAIGPALARGLDPGLVFAEVLGKATGPCAGRGGRGHIAQPAKGFFGAHAVVGGNLSIAAGVALSLQQAGQGGLAVCIFGDGACGAGALHETLNIAALWRLPLLLVCDNNQFSVSTPRSAALAPKNLSDLAAPFGIAGGTVDGMDVEAVYDAAQRLATQARSGAGPAFLECLSHRFTAHSTASRETRSADEMAALAELCPIRRYAKRLRAQELLTSDTLAALEVEAETRIEVAARFADASPFADANEVLCDVG